MLSSIPYDPSLTLAGVVSTAALKNVEQIAAAQAPVDAAQDALNSLISSKRSLRMTQTEMKGLGIDTGAFDVELNRLNDAIAQAATTYKSEKAAAESKILALHKNTRTADVKVESPVDFLKTDIKPMALGADTMNTDVQYFPYDSNSQDVTTYGAQVAAYVSKSIGGVFTPKQSSAVAEAASSQVSRQVRSHHIEGTLVLSITCVYKNASVLEPFHIREDHAIKTWNRLFSSRKLDTTDKNQMMKIARNESQEDQERFSIISGTTFGSCFVGIVYILNNDNAQLSENLTTSAESMQAQIKSDAWHTSASGQTKIDEKFAAELKDLLSQQNVTSHVTLLSMGVTPSIVGPQGQAARIGSQADETRSNKTESSLISLTVMDGEKNKVLDINSMMTALEDYLEKARSNTGGVPINFHLKDIDAKMLAEMWVAKHYPGEFTALKHADSEVARPAESEEAGL